MMRVDSWCDTPLECCYSPQGLRSVYRPSVTTRVLSVPQTAHKTIINKLLHTLCLLSVALSCLFLFSLMIQYESVFALQQTGIIVFLLLYLLVKYSAVIVNDAKDY